jgi:hypothetical protein
MWVDTIITIAAVLGAIGAIIGAVVKVVKFLKGVAEKIEGVTQSIDELKTHSNENYMSLLRLTIMSSEMPIGERINAGYKYLENKGNGEIKQFLKNEFDITETVEHAKHYKK